jgi:hypothetical protein
LAQALADALVLELVVFLVPQALADNPASNARHSSPILRGRRKAAQCTACAGATDL